MGGGRQRGESEGKKEGRDIQVVDGKRQRGTVKEEETERRDREEETEGKRQRVRDRCEKTERRDVGGEI